MSWAVVALAHDDVQMCLTGRFRISYTFLEDVFGFFNVLPVQIDCIRVDAAFGVVLAEDEFRGLLVVPGHIRAMCFAFFGELMGARAVPTVIGLLGLKRTILLATRLELKTMVGCCARQGIGMTSVLWRNMMSACQLLVVPDLEADHILAPLVATDYD